MEIHKDIQYNQGIGKFKTLSTAGVGSIVTTKAGFFIMPKSVSDWGFVKSVNIQIEKLDIQDSEQISKSAGVDIINDPRFVEFLKETQRIVNLKYLIDVPHLSLDNYNNPKVERHPLYVRFKENTGNELRSDHFYIPAIHFPRWFYSRKEKLLKPLEEWKDLWKERTKDIKLQYFAPPRDPFTKTRRKFKDNNKQIDIYETLIQIPIVLICKNGHISDIPWYQLFCAWIDGKKEAMKDPKGFELFEYPCQECMQDGGKHEIQWIENRNNAESWGVIKCKKCGKTYSLEGIMNIHPFCKGDTPWNGLDSRSDELCKDVNGNRSVMQAVLVTSNSVYYANSFSSLYIPTQYLPESVLPAKLQKVLNLINDKWFPKSLERRPGLSKEDYIKENDIIDKADDNNIELTQKEADVIINRFLQVKEIVGDSHEQYRFEEYNVFSNFSKSIPQVSGLEFKDIDLPIDLKPYFKKIQQIDTLAMTLTQLGFSRVSMPAPLRINGVVKRSEGQRIYKESVENVHSLPANQSFGEGLFFEFDMVAVKKWVSEHNELNTRYDQPDGDIGKSLKEEIKQYGAPQFYLLHTFSHIIMKALEFSCGYPTASLQERLYYSNRMCGVLIYTTDGSEGSMGGLVWQGQPSLILKIIKSALNNAKECSSDPLCWENTDQLNLAACFSCCLVSETSCEKRNLGLDRRALIDSDFGYFKDLVYAND